jgi:hypothetical protein
MEGKMCSKHLTGLLAFAVLGLAACSDGVAPGGSTEVPEEVRQDIVSLLEESGFFGDDLGTQGATDGGSSAATVSMANLAGAEEAMAPRVWGRRRGLPVRRQITIEVDEEAGTAMAWKEVEFDGRFLLDITDDGQRNPTEKPLQETVFQHAEFERLDQEITDERGHRHRWRLVAVSPAQFRMAEEAKRTVSITQLTVEVNGEIRADITDPSAPIEVERGVPKLRRGDEVTVTAYVSNDEQGNVPPTFVFLHLFHASPDARTWLRLPMAEVLDQPGVYARSWTVRQTGRERVAVDAIDAQTFVTQSEDDYRANVWGVPYIVLDGPAS